MPIRVVLTRDYAHMSEAAAGLVKASIIELSKTKKEVVLGLATGRSPAGMYKHLAGAANDGEFDSGRIRSFNLDEYVGLPGENPQQRIMRPQSYCYFMIQEFFGLLKKKFVETNVPAGSLVDREVLTGELEKHPGDWAAVGAGAGKSIVLKREGKSPYLAWIKADILDGYARKIEKAGGIDLQIVGVGGRGHVAFHESGIPFEGSSVMLVVLDDDTVRNSVLDGHFSSAADCPSYAISMGAELIFRAGRVVVLADGERKVEAVTRSLLGRPTPEVPLSYGLTYAEGGGTLIYVLDRIAGRELEARREALRERGIVFVDLT